MKRFLLLAAACCFLLASCSSGGVKPTGDPEKDAKALMDFQTQKTKEMTDALSHLKLSKAGEIGKEMEKVNKEFQDFYAKNTENKAKFDEIYGKLANEAAEGVVNDIKGWFDDAGEKAEEAVENAAEAVEQAAEKVTE